MILFQLTNTSASDQDSEARAILACAQALADSGHEVTLVTPIEEHPILGAPRRFSGAPLASLPIPGEHEVGRPDIVHVHHPFLVGEEALGLAERHDAPLVFTATLRYENPFPLPPAEAAHLRAFIENLGICFANRCDTVVAPSPAVAVRLFEGGVTRPIHVVPEEDNASVRAARLIEIYSESMARRRSRGPVRECGAAGRLRHELALAWNRVHPTPPASGRGPRGILAGLRDGSALPC